MKTKVIVIASLMVLPFFLYAQEVKKEVPKFGINFSGFVKTDIFYDSRQTVNAREGHFMLFPDNISTDANGNDINDKSTFNILSIQSRLTGAITGPDAFGAKTSGVLEGDFFGNVGTGLDDVNGFRLRHAFVKLNWKSTELLVGQYWHPMFIAESFPGVLSFNTGAPFQPFSRNPQIRVSKMIGGLKLIGCLFSQRDFASNGPDGVNSKYHRNSAIPNAHFQVQFAPDSTEHLFGVGLDYKALLPEIYTVDNTKTKQYESSETIGSVSAIAFAKLKFKPITVKIEGVYAQNAFDMTMLGGYAVSQITDSLIGAKDFTNLNTGAVWLDMNTNGKKVQFGLFAGYTKILGASDNITTDSYYKKEIYYARGSNIDNIYRITPRVVFISGKLQVGIEIENTVATYGKANGDKKGGVTDGKAITNTRGLLAVMYKF
jgi:hypothetical protein